MPTDRPPDTRMLLIATSVASLLVPLNSTMIAVALPDIRDSFHVGVGALTWLVSCYLIAVAVAQPAAGRLGDAFGHVRTVCVGLIALLALSLASATAWDFGALVATRALQGVAVALVMPNAIAYLRTRAPDQEMGRLFGLNGAAISVGAALGPLIGGVLVAAGGWRWIFIANIPGALIALLFMARLPDNPRSGRRGLSIDLVSLGAIAGAFTSMALIGTAARARSIAAILASLAMWVAAIGVYWLRYRLARRAVVDLRLFTRRNYAGPAAAVALANLVMYTALLAIPLYLGDVRGLGDLGIGLMLFAMSLAMVLSSPVAGRMADRFGNRRPMVAGALALTGGAALMALLLSHPPIVILVVPLLLVGLGVGLGQPAQQSAALLAWPPAMAGSASGTLTMMRYIGSVAGTALIAGILAVHPTEGEFRELFGVLTLFAILAFAASLTVHDERDDFPATHPGIIPEATLPVPDPPG